MRAPAHRSRAPCAVPAGFDAHRGTEWSWLITNHPPCGACSEATPAELHGSGARSTQSVAQAVFLARLLAVERATPNQFRSDTFCRGLVVTPAGEADTPERLYDVPLTNPPGYGSHARFPEQTPLKPVQACFREARLPENPAFAGPFRDQSRLSSTSAKRWTIRRTQGAFHRGETRARRICARQAERHPATACEDRDPQRRTQPDGLVVSPQVVPSL